MQLYFSINAHQIRTKSDKVLAASTYLEGPAADWFEPYLRAWFGKAKEDRDNNIMEVFKNYNQFIKLITITFGKVDKKVMAAQKIQRLHQMGLVLKYVAKFQQIASYLDQDKDTLANQFYYGLKDNIKDKIARIVNHPIMPTKMIEVAVRINN